MAIYNLKRLIQNSSPNLANCSLAASSLTDQKNGLLVLQAQTYDGEQTLHRRSPNNLLLDNVIYELKVLCCELPMIWIINGVLNDDLHALLNDILDHTLLIGLATTLAKQQISVIGKGLVIHSVAVSPPEEVARRDVTMSTSKKMRRLATNLEHSHYLDHFFGKLGRHRVTLAKNFLNFLGWDVINNNFKETVPESARKSLATTINP